MLFGVISFTSCNSVTDALDIAIEVEELREENQKLKEELATLKFELAFPNGLVTESCILNNVKIIREDVNTEGSVYAVRVDGEGVEVTINGGYYDAGSGSKYNIAVWAHHGSKVVINGGEFITGDDVNGEANHCVYAAGGSTIEINGGIFTSIGNSEWLINCQDNNGTIIVKGGTFIGFNPADCISEGEHTSFVAEGYEVKPTEIEGVMCYEVIKSPEKEEVEENPSNF